MSSVFVLLMAKWFLLAAVIGIGVGFWKITERYREGYEPPPVSPLDSAGLPEHDDRIIPAPPEPLPDEEPGETFHQDKADFELLAVNAVVDDALFIEQWGIVKVGDLMPDGSRMVGWWRSGSDYFAKVVKKGLETICRFERSAEKYARKAAEQVAVSALPSATNSVATSIVPAFLGGSPETAQK